jgi:hypothetical protein
VKYGDIRRQIVKLSEKLPGKVRVIFDDGSVEVAPPGMSALDFANICIDEIRENQIRRDRFTHLVGADNFGLIHEVLQALASGYGNTLLPPFQSDQLAVPGGIDS